MTAPRISIVAAEPASRLEQLAAEYAIAKPAADAANARLDAVVEAIKVELTYAAPGATKVDFHAPAFTQPLRLQAKTQWRLDSKKLKENDPGTYARYAAQKTHWELRAAPGGGGQ